MQLSLTFLLQPSIEAIKLMGCRALLLSGGKPFPPKMTPHKKSQKRTILFWPWLPPPPPMPTFQSDSSHDIAHTQCCSTILHLLAMMKTVNISYYCRWSLFVTTTTSHLPITPNPPPHRVKRLLPSIHHVTVLCTIQFSLNSNHDQQPVTYQYHLARGIAVLPVVTVIVIIVADCYILSSLSYWF